MDVGSLNCDYTDMVIKIINLDESTKARKRKNQRRKGKGRSRTTEDAIDIEMVGTNTTMLRITRNEQRSALEGELEVLSSRSNVSIK